MKRYAILETILRFCFDSTSRDGVDDAQTWVLELRRLLADGPCIFLTAFQWCL